ncbi:hypothetical protein PR048_023277 [Dryococelus australis]|uniref:Uncharacterized protein n=1 Tax=Dryococelus australis TaxID=614101 RepID=A0ABQ9GTN4_9NEOP|nr:hypothetical protein PR048_023277 [Dryococelus australis]
MSHVSATTKIGYVVLQKVSYWSGRPRLVRLQMLIAQVSSLYVKRVRFPAGSLPDFRTWGNMPDDATRRQVYSGICRLPRPWILALIHTRLNSPSSTLKTSITLRGDKDLASICTAVVGNARTCSGAEGCSASPAAMSSPIVSRRRLWSQGPPATRVTSYFPLALINTSAPRHVRLCDPSPPPSANHAHTHNLPSGTVTRANHSYSDKRSFGWVRTDNANMPYTRSGQWEEINDDHDTITISNNLHGGEKDIHEYDAIMRRNTCPDFRRARNFNTTHPPPPPNPLTPLKKQRHEGQATNHGQVKYGIRKVTALVFTLYHPFNTLPHPPPLSALTLQVTPDSAPFNFPSANEEFCSRNAPSPSSPSLNSFPPCPMRTHPGRGSRRPKAAGSTRLAADGIQNRQVNRSESIFTAVHDKVSNFEIDLRKKMSLLLPARILTGALSGMRPLKFVTM